MSRLRSVGYGVLGGLSRAAAGVGLVTGGTRVLAYHDVPDEDRFYHQIEWLVRRFRVIGLDEMVLHSHARDRPQRTALVTFDDGDPTVIDRGQPVLDHFGIKAILFVCPGVVDTREPFWWQLVEMASTLGVEVDGHPVRSSDVARLKGLDDSERRDLVRRVRSIVEERPDGPVEVTQVTTGALRQWVDAGHWVGNHTWDHPILSTSSASQQREQIESAHGWLIERDLMNQPVFAYPNGDRTPHSEAVLRDLGYTAGMLFDHRVDPGSDVLNVSRLRVNGDDDLDIFASKLSGLHPALHSLRARVGR